MKGYIDNLDAEQEKALQEMKQRVETQLDEIQKKQFDLEYSNSVDATLLRFLRARNFDVDQSFSMFAKCLTWRATFNETGVLNITEDSIRNQLDAHKAFFHKTDKEGRPLGYVLVKNHDPNTSDFEELQRYCVYMIEQGLKMLTPPNETCSVVFDLDDIGLKNLDLKACKFMIDLLNECYPEVLGVCIVLNAPWIFGSFWKGVSALLPPETAKKVKILHKHEALEYIDKENIPAALGGEEHGHDHFFANEKS